MAQFIITIRKATVIVIFSIIGFTLTHAETLAEYGKGTFALDLGLGANFAITDSLITNIDIERIKIFFRTSSNDEPECQPQETPQP